jgi:sarcosine oxidase subunit alpha
MMFRLPPTATEWINRERTLTFSFEGQTYQGFVGDTITSALAAAGVMVLGRSFKYHRPRGIFSFANHDVNALFQIGAVPNVRGDVTPLLQGMDVHAVNTNGGLAHDPAALLGRFSRFMPVGFYYKAFNSKRWFAHWEKAIRRLSGLGELHLGSPHVSTPKRYAFCDVLVIGAGASGLGVAYAAAERGARVLLVDENVRPSGASLVTRALEQAVREHPRIELLMNTYAAGCYADRWVALIEPQRMTKLRAKAVVLATGAIEQPAIFRNNDLPGVMLASAATRLARRHAVAVGHRVVMLAANREGYAAAMDLSMQGVKVTHVVDPRAEGADADLANSLRAQGVEVLAQHTISAATAAGNCLSHVELAALDNMGHVLGAATRLKCDASLMSVGWAPALQLLLQAGGSVRFDADAAMHVPAQLPEGYFVAGRANGYFDADSSRSDALRAGTQAAAYAGFMHASSESSTAVRSRNHPMLIPSASRGMDFVDFDEDLQVKDLEHAAQEGFDSIELLKRYTTVGMGPSQGKHSNINAARVLARVRGESMNEVGLTTARPMYHPVPMKHLAGRGFYPQRLTPIDALHTQLGAVWMPAGNWRRPEYYAVASKTREECIAAEVAAVRHSVGLIDVGTLGKIEIYGPQAGEFLDRVYTGRFSDLRAGMTRYGLMLDEAGTIIDDGVIARLADAAFYFTTTTGNSASVYRELLRLNALWGLNCSLVNVTGHRAAFNLAGPRSREVLGKLTNTDLSEAAFPYLAVRTTELADTTARLMRVGFVGELGFEIHVPYSAAAKIWDQLSAAGAASELRHFGVEAQRVLRLEKGHFIVGQDTDGLTNPFEANAAWALRMQKPFFIGQRSLRILQRRGPKQLLVGFELPEREPALQECHLVIEAGAIMGRITSVAYSQALQKTIGLAMVKPELAQLGRTLSIKLTDGRWLRAKVASTPFYDRDNRRQKLLEAA